MSKKDELIAEALYALSEEIKFLGNGGADRPKTAIGAIEGLAMKISESNESIANSLDGVAAAIDHLARAVSETDAPE